MLKITYNGKSYSEPGQAFKDALTDGIEKAIKKDLDRRLEKIRSEINAEGGTIHATVVGDKLTVTYDGFSEQLGKKISMALNGQ